ncbi:unnamed protein product [Discosporangium mesarthrocarpum]
MPGHIPTAGGSAQGSESPAAGQDSWTIGVLIEVMGLALTSARVVLCFNNISCISHHQVLTYHARRQEERLKERIRRAEDSAGEKEWGGQGDGWLDEGFVSRPGDRDPVQPDLQVSSHLWGKDSIAAPQEWCPEYFSGETRSWDPEFFPIMSGYMSGDVVLGSTSDLLLVQSMLVDGLQDVFNDLLDRVSRVPLWRLFDRCPATYGAAFELLLCQYDLLALGLFRDAPVSCAVGTHSDTGSTRARAGHPRGISTRNESIRGMSQVDEGRKGLSSDADHETPGTQGQAHGHGQSTHAKGVIGSSWRASCGGSQGMAMACPSADFSLHEGDIIYVTQGRC